MLDNYSAELIFILLSATTALSVAGSIVLYRRTRLLSFPLGIFFTYYWSLRGAWFITFDELGFESDLTYHYLFEKLFPLRIDQNYVWAITYYCCFILTLQAVLIYLLRPKPITEKNDSPFLMTIHHGKLLLACLLGFAGSFLIFGEQLDLAASSGLSGYMVTRTSENELFTLASFLNRIASIPLGIGFAVFCSGLTPRYIASNSRSRRYFISYLLLGGSFFIFASSLGNKNELLVSLISGVLFYVVNCRRPKYFTLGLMGVVGLLFISAIDILRGIPLADWPHEVTLELLLSAWQIPLHSNEMFGAHLSMYGVLMYEVPIKFGYSIYSIFLSIIPRILWSDRPPDIYFHYADSVRAVEGQGYAIHHATGWYLNFGPAGIFIGAFILAFVWAKLTNGFFNCKTAKTRLRQLFFLIVPWTFVAGFPLILRAGPEAYKGLFVDCMLAPLIVLYFSVRKSDLQD